MILRFLRYLTRFVEDGRTGTPSVKRFGLALAVTVLCGVMLGIGIVLCFTLGNSGPEHIVELVRILSNTLELLAGLVLTAVTTGYLVDKATSKNKDEDEECEEEFSEKRKVARRSDDSPV